MKQGFSSDKPVKIQDHDRFQRYNFSKRIAETILQRDNNDGIVIGIYGAWGEGKTSILNFILTELENKESVLTIKLNPWRYNDEVSLIKNFFEKIANELGKELENKKEKLAGFVSKYGGLGNIFGTDLSEIGKIFTQNDLELLKNRIDDFLKESESKVVVFVDDIDRLDKQEIYALFRLVKLTADFTNTTYILSFDEKMVASSIGERFGAGNEKSGQNFLEKIIQVPLKIPVAQIDALKKYCFELVDKSVKESQIDFNKDDAQRFVNEFSQYVLLMLKTPRLAVRYGNSLSFALPLLKGEVNHVDLMLLEAIKVFYPIHYEFIKANPHILLSTYSTISNLGSTEGVTDRKDELKNELKSLEPNLTKREASAIFSLLISLFPRLDEAFNNRIQHEGEKKWYKEKRIASAKYFNRYFSYAVIEGELSDVAFDEFINSIQASELKDLVESLHTIIKDNSANNFIYKIRSYEDEIDWEVAQKLSLSIALLGDHFPKGGSFFSFGIDGAQGQATNFIYNLLNKHENKTESFELAKLLMEEPIPFEFSYEINNWTRTGKTEEEKIFNDEQYFELANILRERALKESEDIPLFEKYPNHITYLFTSWKEAEPEELLKYVNNILIKTPSKIKDLLYAFTPTATSTSHPEPYKTNFSKEQYEFVSSIIDKKLIHDSIKKLYSEKLSRDEVKFFDFEKKQTDLNIARQFEHWYDKDIKESEEKK